MSFSLLIWCHASFQLRHQVLARYQFVASKTAMLAWCQHSVMSHLLTNTLIVHLSWLRSWVWLTELQLATWPICLLDPFFTPYRTSIDLIFLSHPHNLPTIILVIYFMHFENIFFIILCDRISWVLQHACEYFVFVFCNLTIVPLSCVRKWFYIYYGTIFPFRNGFTFWSIKLSIVIPCRVNSARLTCSLLALRINDGLAHNISHNVQWLWDGLATPHLAKGVARPPPAFF